MKVPDKWDNSRIEETIGVLWLIAALLCWRNGWHAVAVVLGIKSGLDMLGAFYFAIAAVIRREQNNEGKKHL